MEPDDNSRPADLLAELTGLHDMLADPACDLDTIPLLQDVVAPATPAAPLHSLRPLLMQQAESLLQEIIRDFTPQITAELEKRLHQHLQQLIREQEQLHLSQPQDNPFPP